MNSKEQIASRWHADWYHRPILARLGCELRKVLRFLDDVPAKRAELANGGRLTSRGLNEVVREYCGANVVPELRRAGWEAEKTVVDIAARRAKLCEVAIDQKDVLAWFRRQEHRTHTRMMNDSGRMGAILSGDRELRAAVFEGPAYWSGMRTCPC